jgi:small subunit ribosomal protein S1
MIDNLSVDQMLEVGIKRVVDFGAFVDLGGIDGLIPRSEVSWQRNARPEEYLKQGDRIQAKVIEIDQATGKVTLSRRQAIENPWDKVHETLPIGSKVTGSIVSVTNYGAFVRLSEGLDGMIHISDMAWDAAGKKPSDYVAVAQEIEAQVLSIDPESRRISLGLKQLTDDPWGELEAKYPRGSHVHGKVTGLTKYGAFVELEPGVEGMVHVSDFSWEKRISQPRDMVKKGDEIEAVVLEINREKRRLSLGVKQLSESPRERIKQQFNSGDLVEGDVSRVTEFGVFLALGPGIEGFIHVSQLDSERVKSPAELFKMGDRVTAKITKIDPETGKISLSRRQMMKDSERKVVQQYMKSQPQQALNPLGIGELLDNIQLEDDLPPEPKLPQAPAAPSNFPENAEGKALEAAQPAPNPDEHSGTPTEPAPQQTLPANGSDPTPDPSALPDEIH